VAPGLTGAAARGRQGTAGWGRERGAAIITAMLVVALAAVVVSSLFWREHIAIRSIENRLALAQGRWIERAALDWAKVILRADQRSGTADHLGEPWAVPVVDTQLDETVTAGAALGDRDRSAMLAGQIVDAQARFNLASLASAEGQPSTTHVEAFERLLALLGQPETLAAGATRRVIESSPRLVNGQRGAPRRPPLTRLADLSEVEGFRPEVLAALEPFVVVLPRPTTVNVNTAAAEVIAAMIPGVELSAARRFVARRERTFYRSLADAAAQFDEAPVIAPAVMSVSTNFFIVTGVIRYDRVESQSETLLERLSDRVEVIWQHRY
jgi:general secretion pathway protein K